MAGATAVEGTAATDPPTRAVARVLLIDEAERVLLLSTRDADGTMYWFAPGGGIDPDEDAAAAALREVWEETGLRDVQLDGEVWHRRHRFTWRSAEHHQFERWFLARVHAFNPVPQALTEVEQEEIAEYRWWSLSDLEATNDVLNPRALAQLLGSLLATGVPPRPIEIGV